MKKKDRKAISNVIAGIFLFTFLLFYFVILKLNNFYFILGAIILTPIIEIVIYNLLPAKKKSQKNSNDKNKSINRPIASKVNPNRLSTDDKILSLPLEDLSWREFERLCYLYFKAQGYKPRETPEGADGGIDLVIFNKKHKTNEAVQIKHYFHSKNQITVKEIRELNSAKRNYGCLLSMFITTSTFTKDALFEADKFKIDCRDVYWVKEYIIKWKNEEYKNRRIG